MSDELIQNVIETADEAKKHRMELQELLDELEEAKKQVKDSAVSAKTRLTDHFSSLKSCIVTALDQRQTELLEAVSEVETAALGPLAGCETLIHTEIGVADQILGEGKKILSGDVDSAESAEKMKNFKSRMSEIDLNSLPEVPRLQEVACIHVDLPRDGSDIEAQLLEAVQEYGQILGRAPVQIVDGQPRAGGLVLRWTEVTLTDESDSELTEFQLRGCRGDLHRDPSLGEFSVSYQGHSLQTTVRGLTEGVPYSFQVRGRPATDDPWSPWSVPFVATTTVPVYRWSSDVPDYSQDTTHKTVEKVATSPDPRPLYSAGELFTFGHSIVFKVTEVGEGHGATDAIGLSLRAAREDLRTEGVMFVTTQGQVFVDGQEKTTRLPALQKGSVLSFDSEVISPTKARITAEVDDKILTIDWTVDRSAAPQTNKRASVESIHLPQTYFFVRLEHRGWRISVE